jgi:hypothetical protein
MDDLWKIYLRLCAEHFDVPEMGNFLGSVTIHRKLFEKAFEEWSQSKVDTITKLV